MTTDSATRYRQALDLVARDTPVAAGVPTRRGLYDPVNEKDACGVGFIADLKGRKSHRIVTDALEMLHRMDHRGACGCEANTGDGAGIMTGLPHDLLRKVAQRDMGIELPEPGKFAAGNVFLPIDTEDQRACLERVEAIVAEQGQELLGWRDLPTDPDGADVGSVARSTMPAMKQLFIGAKGEALKDAEAFERAVYLIRKRASNEVRGLDLEQAGWFYICSLSTKVIVYKGQLLSWQVPLYYPDLRDEQYLTHLATVHSRFSTNTFPSWDRAQPCRFMSHNGEINTLRGNKNQVEARQGLMKSIAFGDDIAKLFPVIEPDVSDSGTFDNVLELLLMAGRSLPEAVMMMIPEAWENHESMPMARRAFYEFHANLMEPWDGPASIAFTDGKYIGAVLDRNGLRPSRWYQTHDDRVIMASEVGVVDLEPEQIKAKGRLEPGRMFLVDFDKGRIVSDEEIKHDICAARPYGQWIQAQRIDLAELPATQAEPKHQRDTLIRKLQSFGYTTETLSMLLAPMVLQSKEAMGSMGNDAPLAVLSDKPRMIYDYFKQLFAQVTNPPIDPIREEIIMSLETYIGPEGNLLETVENQAHRLHIPQPVLSVEQMASIKAMNHRGWKSKTIDITYEKPQSETPDSPRATSRGPSGNGQGTSAAEPATRRSWATGNGQPRSNGDAASPPASETQKAAMTAALDRVCDQAIRAIDEGYEIVVLSDREAGPDRVPLPALLATGAVHHHLVRNKARTKIGVVVETGEAREVHHFCLLSGYGADAYCPYLAYEAL
ncbi:MAG: glutamate synthase central domain-containing protein, partial [Phycisphaeraceae bacterium]